MMMAMAKPFRLITLNECSDQLRISDRYMRTLFLRTDFKPVLRISGKAFYMRYDFDAWQREYWELCTMELF